MAPKSTAGPPSEPNPKAGFRQDSIGRHQVSPENEWRAAKTVMSSLLGRATAA